MIAFWAAAGLLAAAAAGLILHRAASASRAGLGDPTLSLHRRQLAEIDDLAQRGLLAETERKAAHAEAARRLLAAADRTAAPWSADPGLGRAVAAACALVAAAAAGLYLAAGSPGLPDQPFARRLEAWRRADPATLDAPRMAAVLEAATLARPNDVQAWRFRALAEAASGDPSAAARSLRRAVELAPRRADLWELLGQVLLDQSGDGASPDAEAAFREALKRDPKAPLARFHLARARVLSGDRQGGLAEWRALLADLPGDDPRRAALESAIAEAERPAEDDGQLAAIQGMVASLAARLEAQPDDPEGWVRLVRSYAVLGDAARRDAALASGRARYAARPDVLADLAAAAAAEPMR